MIFYISIFKPNESIKKWVYSTLTLTILLSSFIFSFNYIIDPYNITKYNLLNIKYKFARDDRTEKINYFKNLKKFDTIMLGSSRVYTIDPRYIDKKIGTSTYNFGLGTATVEDLLGVLLFLKRENKLPENLFIGVDFYTFNPDLPYNSYFLRNKELNFLSYHNYNENSFAKLFSIDAFRASIKTLKNHLFNKNKHSRFDALGWAGYYEDYSKRNLKEEITFIKQESDKEIEKIYSSYKYRHIDNKRVAHFNRIKNICNENNINLYLFNTPLHPILLNKLYANKSTHQALDEFINYLKGFKNFKNLYYDKRIYNNLKNFHGSTHTSSYAGKIIVDIVFGDNNE